MQAQPPRVAEQPCVRELAGGRVQGELVVGDLEVAPEVGEVLGEDRGLAVGHQRDADIAAAHDLFGEVADDLAELRREQRAADRAHEAPGSLHETLHVFGGLFAQGRRQSIGDTRRDRCGELLPHREGGLDPGAAREGHRRSGQLRDRGRLAQPQGGQRERLIQVGALAGRDPESLLVGDVECLALRHLPRDAALVGVLERALQLPHDRLHHGRVDVHTREARELLGVEVARGTPEKPADELLEVVFGAGPVARSVVVCHFSRLSAGR